MDNATVEEPAEDSSGFKRSGVPAVSSSPCEASENVDAIVNRMPELQVAQNLQQEAIQDVGVLCGGFSEESGGNQGEGSVQGEEKALDSSKDPKIYVWNIPHSASKCSVKSAFEQFGKVSNVHIVTDTRTGESRGYSVVVFHEKDSIARALTADCTPVLRLYGCQMRVSASRPYKKPSHGSANVNDDSQTTTEALKLSPLYDHGGGEHIQRLPAELLTHIMSFLPLHQLVCIQRVSHQWRSTVEFCLSKKRELDLADSFRFIGLRQFSSSILKRILRMMPGLTRLKTAGHVRSLSHRALITVASCCRNLVELDLNEFAINERALKLVCSRCPKLEELHLPDFHEFSEASIGMIMCNLPLLRRLDLKKNNLVTGKCFALMPKSMEELVLRDCDGLESSWLARLGERGASMQRLDVSGLHQLTVKDCCTMLAGMSQLRSLSMARLRLPFDKCIRSVGMNLIFLNLTSTVLSDLDLKLLVPLLPQLTILELEGCRGLTESGLLHLTKFKQLSCLNLDYVRTVTDNVLASLLNLSDLQSLSICQCFAGRADFTAAGLTKLIVGASKLKELDAGGVSTLTAAVLRHASSQLSPSRQLVIYAGGTPATLCNDFISKTHGDTVFNGSMCVINYNSVPYRMRLFDLDYREECVSDDDYDGLDLDEWFNDLDLYDVV